MKHKVRINVTDNAGKREHIMTCGIKKFPRRLIHALFGENTEVLILSPSQSVESVEVHEMEGEKNYGSDEHHPGFTRSCR